MLFLAISYSSDAFVKDDVIVLLLAFCNKLSCPLLMPLSTIKLLSFLMWFWTISLFSHGNDSLYSATIQDNAPYGSFPLLLAFCSSSSMVIVVKHCSCNAAHLGARTGTHFCLHNLCIISCFYLLLHLDKAKKTWELRAFSKFLGDLHNICE